VRRQPLHGEARDYLGQLTARGGRWAEAKHHLQLAVKATPEPVAQVGAHTACFFPCASGLMLDGCARERGHA
jgi:hypothetical protein